MIHRRLLVGAGLALMVAGLGEFLWENVVTNVEAEHQQAPLIRQLESRIPRPRANSEPRIGDAIGLLLIPSLHLKVPIIEGTDVDELARGVGHYPGTPLPGRPGNVAIAGHRTTYGRPFWDLQSLRPGDSIIVRGFDAQIVYTVRRTEIVAPDAVGVIGPPDAATVHELTLTTCHPRFTALQRYVVHAEG